MSNDFAQTLDGARTWLRAHRAQFTAWRHLLHAQPELAFEEHATAQFVAEQLTHWGLPVDRGIGGTGVVGTLASPGRSRLGLRADMDALPVTECTGRAHRSRAEGRMHACGHDGHTVMLLAAAGFLARYCALATGATQRALPAAVEFIFQPAEENAGGARVMIEDGLFDRHPVDRLFALHNLPGAPAGQFMIRGGPIAAGFDTFDIAIRAGGGHAAFAVSGGDAIGAAAALTSQLHTLVSRHVPASDRAVLAVTQLHGGSAYNVLPDLVCLSGSVRWFNADVQSLLREHVRQHARGVELAFGVQIDVTYTERYPAVINDVDCAASAHGAAQRCAGPASIRSQFEPVMGSDDFAFMLQHHPGAYIAIGNGTGKHAAALHSPDYDFNDELIELGALFWIALALGEDVPATSRLDDP